MGTEELRIEPNSNQCSRDGNSTIVPFYKVKGKGDEKKIERVSVISVTSRAVTGPAMRGIGIAVDGRQSGRAQR